jgi:hypothetical protein
MLVMETIISRWTANLVIWAAMCITSDSCPAGGPVTWNFLGTVWSPGLMCGRSDGDCDNGLGCVASRQSDNDVRSTLEHLRGSVDSDARKRCFEIGARGTADEI